MSAIHTIMASGSVIAAGISIDDSYPESNNSSSEGVFVDAGGSDAVGYSQSFISTGGTLDSAKFQLNKSGAPTGNATAKLYASTGTHGTSAKPTGSALATSDVFDVSTLTLNVFTVPTFNFTGANRVTMTNGTTYCIQFFYNGGNGTDKVVVGGPRGGAPLTDDGNVSYELPVGTFSSLSGTIDMCFYVYKA